MVSVFRQTDFSVIVSTFISGNHYHAHIQLVSFERYRHSLFTRTQLRCTWRNPFTFFLPLLIPFCSPFLIPLYLLGNPPSCDRIRPPWSPVGCKLNSPFPSPCPYTPSSEIPTPRGFSHPNIHLLGRHREPGSQDPAQI